MLDNCEQLLGPVERSRGAGLAGVSGGADPGDEPRGPRGWRRACVAVAVAAASQTRRAGDHRGGERCGGVVHRTRRGGPGDVHPGRVERGGGRGDLSPPRRDPAGDRARRGPGGVDVAVGDQRAVGRTVPAPHRRAAHAVERQQTLRATVDWSYSLLGERERDRVRPARRLRRQLRRPAAQAVVAGDGVEAWDVLDALTELVAKSMVVAEDTAEGTTRYQMLETLGPVRAGTPRRARRRRRGGVAATPSTSPTGPKKPDPVSSAATSSPGGPGERGARQSPGRGDLGPRSRRPRRHRPRAAHHRRARRRGPRTTRPRAWGRGPNGPCPTSRSPHRSCATP